MSILKSRIFRTLALLGCAAFCGILIVGCNSESTDTGAGSSGAGSGTKTSGTPGGDKMAPGSGG